MKVKIPKLKIAVIIQARVGSTRLPGKVLMDIEGKPMLWHVVERTKQAKTINEVILAIPDTKENDALEDFALKNSIKCYRGSENDVLSRYYETAKKFKVDIVARVTSDCPLIDPLVIDKVIREHLNFGADYTANILKRTYPRGLDVEVMNFNSLEKAYFEAKLQPEREHVTPYIQNNPKNFKIVNVQGQEDFSSFRWTVDEKEDMDFVQQIYKRLYKKGKIFVMEEIIKILEKEPLLAEINKKIKQKVL